VTMKLTQSEAQWCFSVLEAFLSPCCVSFCCFRRFEKIIEKLGLPVAAQDTMRRQNTASKWALVVGYKMKQKDSKVCQVSRGHWSFLSNHCMVRAILSQRKRQKPCLTAYGPTRSQAKWMLPSCGRCTCICTLTPWIGWTRSLRQTD
jgi:hypothetical protein